MHHITRDIGFLNKLNYFFMKTISELNKKTWYRLIKVFYVGCFLFITFLSVFLVSSEFQPTQIYDKSYIQCANGKKLDQDYLSSAGVSSVYSVTYNTEAIKKTKFFCLLGEQNDVSTMDLLRSDLTEYKDSDVFEIVYFIEPRNWTATVGYTLLSIIVTMVLFEIVRRIFYYVVLGKFIPEK